MVSLGTLQASTPARWLSRVPRWLREVVLIGLLYVAYEFSRGAQNSAVHIAFRNGRDILRWERDLDIAPEHLLTHFLIGVTPLAVAAAYFYSTMHYVITPVVLIWMYRAHGRHYRTARTALAYSTLLGLVLFYLVPTAPPRLLAGAGIPDALFDVRHWGWWGGDGSVPRGLGTFTNQFAAMPSLHVGWALWSGFLLFRYSSRRVVRVLGVLYPLVTSFVVLSTGNHYLLDVIAGALTMAAGAGLSLLTRRGYRALRARVRAERRTLHNPAPAVAGAVRPESERAAAPGAGVAPASTAAPADAAAACERDYVGAGCVRSSRDA